MGQLACPQREGRDYKGFVQKKGERSRVATWSVWSTALFWVLHFTIWKKGLLKCRKKRSRKFLIRTSTLPEAYLPGFSSAGIGQARRAAGRAGLLKGKWVEHAQLVGITTDVMLAEAYWDHQGFIV